MRCCEVCGALVQNMKLKHGGVTECYLWPFPYRRSEGGAHELITVDGERVRCEPCYPQDRDGNAYREHNHRKEESN